MSLLSYYFIGSILVMLLHFWAAYDEKRRFDHFDVVAMIVWPILYPFAIGLIIYKRLK